ncbi:MAG: hypothetical protein ACTSWP_04610 [Candidatus Freyarchaeota archaeon]
MAYGGGGTFWRRGGGGFIGMLAKGYWKGGVRSTFSASAGTLKFTGERRF